MQGGLRVAGAVSMGNLPLHSWGWRDTTWQTVPEGCRQTPLGGSRGARGGRAPVRRLPFWASRSSSMWLPRRRELWGYPVGKSATRQWHVAEDVFRPTQLCHSLGQECPPPHLPVPQFPGVQKGPTPSALGVGAVCEEQRPRQGLG